MTRILLSPKREHSIGGREAEIPELEEIKESEPPFSADAHDSFQRVMDEMPDRFRLSQFIDRIGTDDLEACHLSIIKLGEWYEERDDQAVATATGETFINGPVYGDDLEVIKPT